MKEKPCHLVTACKQALISTGKQAKILFYLKMYMHDYNI